MAACAAFACVHVAPSPFRGGVCCVPVWPPFEPPGAPPVRSTIPGSTPRSARAASALECTGLGVETPASCACKLIAYNKSELFLLGEFDALQRRTRRLLLQRLLFAEGPFRPQGLSTILELSSSICSRSSSGSFSSLQSSRKRWTIGACFQCFPCPNGTEIGLDFSSIVLPVQCFPGV